MVLIYFKAARGGSSVGKRPPQGKNLLLFGVAGFVILFKKFLSKFVRVDRVFVCLTAKFVGAEVISLIVGAGGCGMGVSGEVMKLGSSIVRTLWHEFFSRLIECL
jgi:hypothetical protein